MGPARSTLMQVFQGPPWVQHPPWVRHPWVRPPRGMIGSPWGLADCNSHCSPCTPVQIGSSLVQAVGRVWVAEAGRRR